MISLLHLTRRTWTALALTILLADLLAGSVVSGQTWATSPNKPMDPVVVRIYITDKNHLSAVAGELDVWEVHHDAGFAVAAVTPEQYQWLASLGYQMEIETTSTAPMGVQAVLDPRFHYFDDHNTNSNGLYVVNFLQDVNAAYPDLTELIDIGDAWEANNGGHHRDVWMLRITNEDPAYGDVADKPPFFLFAGIHAREVATPELAIRYVKYLTGGYGGEGGYGVDPDVTWLVNYNVAYVLVMQNPDGHVRNEQNTSSGSGWGWRKNTDDDDGCTGSYDGVDMNRNHSFFWNSGGASGDPCSETYYGPGAASEPETQAFQNFFATVMRDQNGDNGDYELPVAAPITTTGIFISLHSYSDLVLWPWGHTSTPAPNSAPLQTIGRKLAFFNGYTPQQSSDLYPTSGATDDWTYGKFGLPSYTFEVGSYSAGSGVCGGFFPLYECLDGETGTPRSFWAENGPAFVYAHKIARTPYLTAYGPDSESVTAAQGTAIRGDSVQLATTIADRRCCGDLPQPIAAAEYYVDLPPWVAATTPVASPMTAVDGDFDTAVEAAQATVDTTGLNPGRHILFVRGQSANGDWGAFSAVFLDVLAPTSNVVLHPSSAAQDAPMGQSTTYTLTVTNLGASTDRFLLVPSGNAWTTTLSITATHDLPPLGSTGLQVTVTVPADAALGQSDAVTLTATSQADANHSASSTLTTTARRTKFYLPLIFENP